MTFDESNYISNNGVTQFVDIHSWGAVCVMAIDLLLAGQNQIIEIKQSDGKRIAIREV